MPYCRDIGIGKFGFVVRRTARPAPAAFHLTVQQVVLLGADKQMVRIKAGRIIASMQDFKCGV